MTTTKTKRGRFTPWCWEAERDDYNDESRRGWHLTKRTLRDMTYEYDPDVEYRYAIDYQHWHNEDRYLEFFEPDGWELVGTVLDGFNAREPGVNLHVSKTDGCWYIFRKEYDPGRPDVEYEIATDEESLRAFRRTLTRKYSRLLLVEVSIFLIFFIRDIFFPLARVPFLTFLLGLSMLHAGYCLLCVNVFRPRKPVRTIPDFHSVRLILSMLFIISCTAYILSINQAEQDANAALITASNTPVQLFLDLRPDITVDEVMLLAEEYNLEVTEYYGQRSASTGERTLFSYYSYTHEPIYTIDLVPDLGENRLSFHFYENVGMALVYDPDTMVLESAYLSINTGDGRAYCHYFPGEPTVEDCETGYNLFLRKSALSRQKYYHAETAREIIDIAYPVLYPEGLE